MKKILIISFIAIMMMVSCGHTVKKVEVKSTPAKMLINRLDSLRHRGIMYGHQDDPFYGITWHWEKGRSDTRELTGDYPAVMGFDMAGLELGDSLNIDSVPFAWMRQEIIAHHQRGGIVTLSWHPRNPLTGGNTWDVSDTTVVSSILPGGKNHEKFCGWIDSVSVFLESLVDNDGKAVPVILRPWHENNGSWFWWGQKLCSAEQYKSLWNMFQDSINVKFRDNIVWSYSPNLYGHWTEDEFMKRYPGDDRVDLLGTDCYQWGTEKDFIRDNTADVKYLSDFAHRHNLLFAVTECGMKNSPVADWWSRVFLPIIKDYDVCYFLPWRNFSKEHFGASKDAATAEDFKSLADSKAILLLGDIQ